MLIERLMNAMCRRWAFLRSASPGRTLLYLWTTLGTVRELQQGRAGDLLISVLSISTGEKEDLTTTQGESIRRAQFRLQGLVLGVAQGTPSTAWGRRWLEAIL